MATITYLDHEHTDSYGDTVTLAPEAWLYVDTTDAVFLRGLSSSTGQPSGTYGNVWSKFFGTTGLLDVEAAGSFKFGGLSGMPTADSVYTSVTLSFEGVEMVKVTGLNLSQSVVDQMGFFDAVMSGNDTIKGSADIDILMGGKGNDTYYINDRLDMVVEKAGEGTDAVRIDKSYKLPDNVENLVLTGSGYINGVGNALNNKLYGNSVQNMLNGGVGADTMTGGGGSDIYIVDNVLDVVVETDLATMTTATATSPSYPINDVVRSYVSYTLSANVEHLSLNGTSSINGAGNAGNNSLTGNSGANRLTGGDGNDYLTGREGSDVLDGGLGTDSAGYGYTNGAVTVNLGTGTATGAAGSDTLVSIENVFGSNYSDSLIGSSVANSINGAYGNDTLAGGAGLDTLTGGVGLDVFKFDTTLGSTHKDVITDFISADDTIQLENAIFTKLAAGALTSGILKTVGVADASVANDYLVYNKSSGALYYDADGGTDGYADGIQIALIATKPALTHADFVII